MIPWSQLRESLNIARGGILPPNMKLPVLPVAIMRFSDRANDPEVPIAELGQIIETDAGLMTELLRYVNSSAVGLRQKAATAQQAVSMLGIKETRLFMLGTAVKRSMKTSQSKLINLQNFWATNLERAIFARIVARLLKADPELAFAGGLLQDFLLPVLSNELYEPYIEFSTQQLSQPIPLADYERQRFRWTHAEAAAQVMLGWHFPDDLVCCVALHHHGLRLLGDKQLGMTAAAAVAVSALMPCPLRQAPDGIAGLIRLEQSWPAFKLLEVAKQVEAEYQQLSPGSSNAFSFRRTTERLLAGAR